MIDPVEALARDDKWQLAAGDGTRFAPAFPRWLDAPGFWDGGEFRDAAIAPLFTLTMLSDGGTELAPRAIARRWTPAELTVQYRLGQGITATEVRTLHPRGVYVSEWRFAAYKPCRVHLIAWTAQHGARVPRGSAVWNGSLGFRVLSARANETDSSPAALAVELACVGGAESWATARSAGGSNGPEWRYSPFVEQWRGTGLPRVTTDDAGPDSGGLFFAAVHRILDIEYAGASATFAMRVAPAEPAGASTRKTASRAPADGTAAAGSVAAGTRQATFSGASRRRWSEYFSERPGFRCSDPYFESIWRYRWYLLRLRAGQQLPAHARELAWCGDADGARNALLASGAPDADDAVLVDALFGDDAIVRALYPGLTAAAETLLAEGNGEPSGMFDLSSADPSFAVRSGESRGDARPDRRERGDQGGSLKGIDTNIRGYSLFKLLAAFAGRAGAGGDAARWGALAERTRAAVREKMWNKKTKAFSDVNSASLKMTNVKSAHIFLPYGTDIADGTHIAGLEKHLLNPAEFFTPFPVPSLSADDPRFSAEGEWRGARGANPWNGRNHPAMSAKVVDAFAHASRLHAPHLRPQAAALLRRFVRMMFDGGELQRVNSRAHYNPSTGHSAEYTGREDLLDAPINDLIVRHVMGIGATAEGISIDPLPCGLEHAELGGVTVRGRSLAVLIDGDEVTATVDGVRSSGPIGTMLSFPTAPK